jgi:hypothetical protein
MTGRLAHAFSVSQTALAHVVAIFDRAGDGEPVPASMAEDTVSRLLAGARPAQVVGA